MTLFTSALAIKATLFGVALAVAAMTLGGERCLAHCAGRTRGAGR